MSRWHSLACVCLLTGLIVLRSDSSAALNAEDVKPLRFGMSAALTGPTADLGLSVREGIQVAFREENDRGGVRGRPLELIALDDGYEPSQTAPNMRTLIREFEVVGIIGNVGAPCAVAAVPIANAERTPLIGYVTGGAVLRRTPPDPYVVNYRAGLAEEVAAIVDGFVGTGTAVDRVGFITQRDAYGDSVFIGGMESLKRRGLGNTTPILHARYERNTLAVEEALSELLLWPETPDVLILGAAAAPAAAIIRQARELGYRGRFATFSFVDAEHLASLVGPEAEGIVVTQVVPPLSDGDLPAVRDFRIAASQYAPKYLKSHTAFEGYVIARIVIMALRNETARLDREGINAALLALGDFDLGLGRPLRLSTVDHQASHAIWPTIIHRGSVEPLDWADLKREGR